MLLVLVWAAIGLALGWVINAGVPSSAFEALGSVWLWVKGVYERILADFSETRIAAVPVLMGGLIGAIILIRVFLGTSFSINSTDREEVARRARRARRRFLQTVVAIYLGAVVAAFIIAGNEPLTMPIVHVETKTTQEGQKESPPTVDGTLITHSDSFWYIIEEARKKGSSRNLVAIPDDRVELVQLTGTAQISP